MLNLITRIPAQRKACPSWCVNHDYSENYCTAANTPIPGVTYADSYVGLMSHPDSGTVIDLYRCMDDVLTLDDAAQLGHTLLATVAIAEHAAAKVDTPCAVSWCVSNHHGERPEGFSHWDNGAEIPGTGGCGPLLVDLHQAADDGAEIVLTSGLDHEQRLTVEQADQLSRQLAARVAIARKQAGQ